MYKQTTIKSKVSTGYVPGDICFSGDEKLIVAKIETTIIYTIPYTRWNMFKFRFINFFKMLFGVK